MNPRLIVALDFENQNKALDLVSQLDPTLCALKVGSEMFTIWGVSFVKQLIARQFKVFLDLKFHDIPNTVAKACKASADMGVWMMNVHASGGFDMMQAAVNSISSYGSDKPLLIAVTVLTSFNENELNRIGVAKSLIDQVTDLASLARDSGLDGVVCSAHEVNSIKQRCGAEFITVTPGIRLPNSANDDQSRIMTPKKAIIEGSDYIVIGRPITSATNPSEVVNDILFEINNV